MTINDFYQGYKKFDLRPGELLVARSHPAAGSRRTVAARTKSRAAAISISPPSPPRSGCGSTATRLPKPRIAFGAVGPTVIRARKTEEFLRGQPFDEETMRPAGDVAVGEITPISDVRGSAELPLSADPQRAA